MSAFKVGQRVKKISHPLNGTGFVVPMGADGVVENVAYENSVDPACHYAVRFAFDSSRCFYMAAYQLAPLTDPLAEQFIERIKRLEREPAPLIKEKA